MPQVYRRVVDRHVNASGALSQFIEAPPNLDPLLFDSLQAALVQRILLCVRAYTCELLERHRKPVPLAPHEMSLQAILDPLKGHADVDELRSLLNTPKTWLSALLQRERTLLQPSDPNFSNSIFASETDVIMVKQEDQDDSLFDNTDLAEALSQFKQILIRQRACNEEY